MSSTACPTPPKRDLFLAWQSRQVFPIYPKPQDPDVYNAYRELGLPDDVSENIEEYCEQQFLAQAER